MLTLTLRVTQKHVFHPPKIETPFICHESFSLKFSCAKKKESMDYVKKSERDIWSSQNSKRKEKNGTHEGSIVLKKRDSPYFQGNY